LVPAERKKYLDDSKYWYGFLSEEEAGSWIRMRFSNDELHGFASWLLNTGAYARIEEPEELKTILHHFIQETVNAYSDLFAVSNPKTTS